MRNIFSILLVDSRIAAFMRLISITLAVYILDQLPEVQIWVDKNIGASETSRILIVAALFFLIQLIVSRDRVPTQTEQRLEEVTSQLKVAQNEIQQIRGEGDPHSPEGMFNDAIIAYVSTLSEKGRDNHVLRLQDVLSRYLWVEGLLRARIAVGDAAAKAAARLGDEERQVAALIDDLGWTLVAMDERDSAKEKIQLGLRLSERNNLAYWIAKAFRHMSGIATLERNFEDAALYLKKSETAAENIEDESQKFQMLAGITYANAVTCLYEGRYEDAMKLADKSAEIRMANGDVTRSVRSYALKGKILLRIGGATSRGEARAVFLRGLKESESVGRRDEIIRNLNGLAAIAEMEKDHTIAAQYRERAAQMVKETPVPYELLDQA